MSRSERKIDHIRHALGHDRDFHNHFDDMDIVHQSLAQLDFDQLSIDAQVGELNLSSPLFVNAMTGGGGEKTEEINRKIAEVASRTGIGMAVGSQMSALKNPEERTTYEVVRRVNPEGIVFANIGSEGTIEQAEEAVEMLQADALQIHINTLQEMIMPEGDRDFTQRLEKIERILNGISVPVIIKEVGYGMSRETVKTLKSLGVSYIDVGGRGGTNFSKVENMRRQKPLASYNNWGIPTPVSVLEARENHPDIHIIGSGGIRNGLDGVKAMVLGAQAFGMAGALLRVLLDEGEQALEDEILHIHHEVKVAMMLLNITNVNQFKDQPYVLYGKTKEWVDQRLRR
ncbi:type 2 isopentenyl-diphosphate Delta-isomerase [Halobacillus yeomjeoni]|uniref:Isopentenyl-diphosphate delta-isomerase n=1 Tax=Halobacillus yeomjeoni TaxID=311194 RepID=A0A931MUE1_9BACI|nr:type 2 isopentenyl-diphosphate Delta-isomerase [Halobacillus yeomjeoni]MBH0229602.1 type 2 isopentenyl-diphosphate Delta-isomerase [Halobacillus yeomjeoni]